MSLAGCGVSSDPEDELAFPVCLLLGESKGFEAHRLVLGSLLGRVVVGSCLAPSARLLQVLRSLRFVSKSVGMGPWIGLQSGL